LRDHSIGWLYRYLSFLLENRLQNRALAATYSSTLDDLSDSGLKKGAKRKPKPAQTKAKPSVAADTAVVELLHAMSFGTLRTLQFFLKKGYLQPAEYHLVNPEHVFAHRFQEYLKVPYPEPLTYADYVQRNDLSKMDLERVTKSASDSFKFVRENFEKLMKLSKVPLEIATPRIRALVRVAVANSVSIATADLVAMKHNGAVTVNFNFSLHPHFPVISLKSRTVAPVAGPAASV